MENLSEMLKGVLEGIVLEIINNGEIYGYEIVRQLNALGFEGIAEGTVYALLVRLEKNRMVNIVKKPSEIGPPRKFYTLNERGRDELMAFWERWDFLNNCIKILRNNGGKNHELQQ
jgi:PadR family transcriptional regulator, regulatory protein PadR